MHIIEMEDDPCVACAGLMGGQWTMCVTCPRYEPEPDDPLDISEVSISDEVAF